MNKKIGASIVAAVTALVVVTTRPGPLPVTTQILQASNGAVFTVQSAGADRLLLVGVGYGAAGGRKVMAIRTTGQDLIRLEQGTLGEVGSVELWYLVGPPEGSLPVTLSLSDDFDAEIMAVLATNVDQQDPIAGSFTGVGKLVKDSSLPCPPGSATVAIVLSVSSNVTLAVPQGFISLGTEAGALGARLSGFLDDDHSAGAFALAFSDPAHFGAMLVGVNLAP